MLPLAGAAYMVWLGATLLRKSLRKDKVPAKPAGKAAEFTSGSNHLFKGWLTGTGTNRNKPAQSLGGCLLHRHLPPVHTRRHVTTADGRAARRRPLPAVHGLVHIANPARAAPPAGSRSPETSASSTASRICPRRFRRETGPRTRPLAFPCCPQIPTGLRLGQFDEFSIIGVLPPVISGVICCVF